MKTYLPMSVFIDQLTQRRLKFEEIRSKGLGIKWQVRILSFDRSETS